MLDVEKKMSRFTQYPLRTSFEDYLATLSNAFSSGKVNGSCRAFYQEIFRWLTDMKLDYLNAGDMYMFLCQLLFGCRFSEVPFISTKVTGDSLCVDIISLKGTQNRFLLYSVSSPLITLFLSLGDTVFTLPSYKSYYQSLKRSCPNLYSRLEAPHLLATHLARHYFIQVLFYVLGLSKSKVIDILSWMRDDTINSYIDQKIWRKLNIRGSHDQFVNKVIGESTSGRKHSDSDRSSGSGGKKSSGEKEKK